MKRWLPALLVASCCPSAPPPPAASPTVARTPPAKPAPLVVEPAATAAVAEVPPEGACRGPDPGGFVPPEEPEPDATPCRPNATAERKVRAALTRAYSRVWEHSRVEVAFDCDPIAGRLRSVAHEKVIHHTYAVELLWRDGERFRTLYARKIRAPQLIGKPAPRRVFIRRGSVPGKQVDALKGPLRAYLSARIREVEAENSGVATVYGRLSLSPYEMLRLQDEHGSFAATGFSDSQNRETQRQYLPLKKGLALLQPAFSSVSGDAETLEPEERRALAAWSWGLRFAATNDKIDPAFRAAAMAEIVDSRDIVPLLLHAAFFAAESRNPNAKLLIGALKRLTEFDPPAEPEGSEDESMAVAHAYWHVCAPLYGLPSDYPP